MLRIMDCLTNRIFIEDVKKIKSVFENKPSPPTKTVRFRTNHFITGLFVRTIKYNRSNQRSQNWRWINCIMKMALRLNPFSNAQHCTRREIGYLLYYSHFNLMGVPLVYQISTQGHDRTHQVWFRWGLCVVNEKSLFFVNLCVKFQYS